VQSVGSNATHCERSLLRLSTFTHLAGYVHKSSYCKLENDDNVGDFDNPDKMVTF
jgi:hypothetical protein